MVCVITDSDGKILGYPVVRAVVFAQPNTSLWVPAGVKVMYG